MLDKYRQVIDDLSWPVGVGLRSYFRLPAKGDLFQHLQEAHLTQADVVLALLKDGRPHMREAAEAIIGAPIKVGHSTVPPPPSPVRLPPRTGDERRFTKVAANPRLPTTDSAMRYRLMRPGRTIAEFLRRGGTRRDIREALRAGWVEIEEDNHPCITNTV